MGMDPDVTMSLSTRICTISSQPRTNPVLDLSNDLNGTDSVSANVSGSTNVVGGAATPSASRPMTTSPSASGALASLPEDAAALMSTSPSASPAAAAAALVSEPLVSLVSGALVSAALVSTPLVSGALVSAPLVSAPLDSLDSLDSLVSSSSSSLVSGTVGFLGSTLRSTYMSASVYLSSSANSLSSFTVVSGKLAHALESPRSLMQINEYTVMRMSPNLARSSLRKRASFSWRSFSSACFFSHSVSTVSPLSLVSPLVSVVFVSPEPAPEPAPAPAAAAPAAAAAVLWKKSATRVRRQLSHTKRLPAPCCACPVKVQRATASAALHKSQRCASASSSAVRTCSVAVDMGGK